MTLPPEPDDPALVARLRQGMAEVGERLVSLLRYQPLGGAPSDKAAAALWLGRRGLTPLQRVDAAAAAGGSGGGGGSSSSSGSSGSGR